MYSPNIIMMAIGWTIGLVIIVAFFWILSSIFSTPEAHTKSVEDALKRRLVEGEIDADECDRRLKELSETKKAA